MLADILSGFGPQPKILDLLLTDYALIPPCNMRVACGLGKIRLGQSMSNSWGTSLLLSDLLLFWSGRPSRPYIIHKSLTKNRFLESFCGNNLKESIMKWETRYPEFQQLPNLETSKESEPRHAKTRLRVPLTDGAFHD